jgi:hypothetical protein
VTHAGARPPSVLQVTYDEATGDTWLSNDGAWWGGHCWHFTNPWLHWHRAYVMQYEKAVTNAAKSIAKVRAWGGGRQPGGLEGGGNGWLGCTRCGFP